MHMASKGTGTSSDIKQLYGSDERNENPGRPEKQGSYGRHKDPGYGLDPFGEKKLSKKEQTFISKLSSKKIEKLYEDTNINQDTIDSIQFLNEKQLENK